MAKDHYRSAIGKAAIRLLPFLTLCYAVNFLDRVNVGFAALTMNADLAISPETFGFGAGIFFAGYLLFEVPSNLALQYFGARIWIARIMISWGLVAMAMSFVSGPYSFHVMRFLLGVAEAGFFPGIILYLTYWFPVQERARIVSLFMTAVPLATVIGAPLSGLLLELDGVYGLKGWQWLFIIEGVPAVVLGFAALKVLDDGPAKAKWLSGPERKALNAALAADERAARSHGYTGLVEAMTKPRIFALALLYFLIVIGLYGIGFWMPQLIKNFGLPNLTVGFLTAIPYLVASVVMVACGWNSDRTGERRWHIALPLLIGGIAFAWSAYAHDLLAAMIALSIATAGIYAAVSSFWSLPTAILSGSAAAAGVALINSIGNLGGFVGPTVVGAATQATGSFARALLFLATALAAGALLALLLGRRPERGPASLAGRQRLGRRSASLR
jgi:ACS family tartrate transporter-like MFS transporter